MINSKCIFVGNIPYDYDEKGLNETLSLVGPVKSFNIKYDDETKKSKGYGFCEYTDPEIASSALRNLKSVNYKGRTLRINIQDKEKSTAIAENIYKAGKDIIYVRNNENENINLSNVLKNMSDEQKYFVLVTMMNVMNKNEKNFKENLKSQSDEVLDAILELQNSFIRDYK